MNINPLWMDVRKNFYAIFKKNFLPLMCSYTWYIGIWHMINDVLQLKLMLESRPPLFFNFNNFLYFFHHYKCLKIAISLQNTIFKSFLGIRGKIKVLRQKWKIMEVYFLTLFSRMLIPNDMNAKSHFLKNTYYYLFIC